MNKKIRIDNFQIFATLVITVLGINLFSYPRNVATYVETEGWIVTIIASIVALLVISTIHTVVRINEFKGFNNLLEDNLGEVFGRIIGVVFAAYTIIFSATSLRIFAEVIKMYLLEKTPTEVVIAVLILLAIPIIREGLNGVVKFNTVVFWFIFIPLALTMILTVNNLDLTNVLPVFNNTPINYFKGTMKAMYSFTGIVIAYMIIPYAKNRGNIQGILCKSILFICISYCIVTIFSLGIFTRTEVKTLLWPTITMIKSVDIPGAFVERWEGIVMVFWILFFYTNFINMFFFSSEVVGKSFRILDNRISFLIIVPIYYILSLAPDNIAQIYESNGTGWFKMFGIFILISPFILYVIGKFRKKEVCKEDEK